MSRFAGEPPFDQMPARQDEFRASIAEALGHTHPGMEGQYVMSDRDMLKAILELRANVSEDARQLQEARTVRNDLGEQLRQTTTVMKRLHGERDEARDALKAMTAERDMAARIDLTAVIHEMVRERDEALEHCESARFGETLVMRERDEARAECLRLRSVRAELERLVASL